ncbi:MAU2 chromatid cohesion factor-like protein, partial [Fragariocoptes setiger]
QQDIETCHVALLNLAEEFRTKQPPDLKSSLQCLMAVLNLPVYDRIAAKTNLQIGNLIYHHSTDPNNAQVYFERAYEHTNSGNAPDIRFEVVSILADIYIAQDQLYACKQLLSKSVEESRVIQGHLYWHYKFLFKLSQLHLNDKEFLSAATLLANGAETTRLTDDLYTRVLFLLSKGMVMMIARKYQDPMYNQQIANSQEQIIDHVQQLAETLTLAGNLLEHWPGDSSAKEALKVFFLVLQVCHHLNGGCVKNAKPCLRLLQQSIQSLTNALENPGPNTGVMRPDERFSWLPKDSMCVLVYLITVIHSMQAGFLDKAQKYTEKALTQIERLRAVEPNQLLETFQVLLLEHMSMCRLVMGHKSIAIKEIVQALQLCYHGNPRLKVRHRGNVHMLLGLYAISMSLPDDAENHLKRVISDNNVGSELRIMSMLNLALCYLRTRKETELNELLPRLNPETLTSPPISICLKAAAYYVYGLNAFTQTRYNDAKRHLRETLKLANGEDLNRLTSCSLVLLGNIFYNLGNQRESMNMVIPGMQLASKIPDIHVQLWAAALLKDLYNGFDQQRHMEAINMHQNFSQLLYNDQYQAALLPEHNYL